MCRFFERALLVRVLAVYGTLDLEIGERVLYCIWIVGSLIRVGSGGVCSIYFLFLLLLCCSVFI